MVKAKSMSAMNSCIRDERPAFGGAVSGAVRESLESAAHCYREDAGAAGRWLEQAAAVDPNALAVYFARYKFHFYQNHLAEAETAAREGLAAAAAQGGFPADWRSLTRESASWQTRRGATRLYLFSLKALGVIRLRRGKVDNARRVLEKLLELDPGNEIGGEAFLQIARAFEEEN
jgi:tetratricopeptide (TPR) repeat protein